MMSETIRFSHLLFAFSQLQHMISGEEVTPMVMCASHIPQLMVMTAVTNQMLQHTPLPPNLLAMVVG